MLSQYTLKYIELLKEEAELYKWAKSKFPTDLDITKIIEEQLELNSGKTPQLCSGKALFDVVKTRSGQVNFGYFMFENGYFNKINLIYDWVVNMPTEEEQEKACIYLAKTVNRNQLSRSQTPKEVFYKYQFETINSFDTDIESLPLKEVFLKVTRLSDNEIHKNSAYSFLSFTENKSVYSLYRKWRNEQDTFDYLKWILLPKNMGDISIQITPNSYTQVANPYLEETSMSGVSFTDNVVYFKEGVAYSTGEDFETRLNEVETLEKYALDIQANSKYSVIDISINTMLQRLATVVRIASSLTTGNVIPKESISYKLIFDIEDQKSVVVPSNDIFQSLLYLKAMGSDKISLFYDEVKKNIVVKGKSFEQEIVIEERVQRAGSRFFDVKKVKKKIDIPTFGIINEQKIDELTPFCPIEYVEFFQDSLTLKQKYDKLNTQRNKPLQLDEKFIAEYPEVANTYEQQSAVAISNKNNDQKIDYVLKLIENYLNSYTEVKEEAVLDEEGNETGDFKYIRNAIKTDDWDKPNYVLKVNEAYWQYNNHISTEEILSFFISKGDQAGYRELCLKILGVDYKLFEQPIINYLVETNDIFVSNIDIDEENIEVDISYEPKNEFISGNIYKKEKYINESSKDNGYAYSKALSAFFGDGIGSDLYSKASSTIQDALDSRFVPSLVPMVKNPEEAKKLELNIDISCPIFFRGKAIASNEIGGVGVLTPDLLSTGSQVNTLNIMWGSRRSKSYNYGHYGLFKDWLDQNRDKILGGYSYQEIRDAYIFPIDRDTYIKNYVLDRFKANDSVVGFKSNGGKKLLGTIINATEETRIVLKDIGYIKDESIVLEQEAKEIKKKIILLFKERYWSARREGRRLFNQFLRKSIDNVSRQAIDELWNETYNNYAKPDLKKVPIFPSLSYKFGKKTADRVFNLMDAQKEGIRHTLSRNNSGLLLHEVGYGKGHLLTSDILTPNGFIKMGDIKVGTEVIAVDGKPTKVNGVFPLGKIDCYKVTFSDGSSTEVSKDHLWKVQTINYRGKYPHKWDILETEELIERGLKNVRGNRQFSIPMVSPVEFNEQKLPIHPYVLGALLGDGCFSQKNEIKISNPDQEIIDRVKSLLPDGVDIRKQKGDNCDYRIVRSSDEIEKNYLLESIRELGLSGKYSHNKFIPEIYKFNTVENRIELLRGIFDTDGTVQRTKRNGNSSYFSTASKELAEGVRFLVESFGGTVSTRIKKPFYTYNGEKKEGKLSYNVTVRLPQDINPFFLSRKRDLHIPKTKYKPVRLIESIEPIGKIEAQCISVEHKEHLYCCENFIVTHNTTSSITAISSMMNTGEASRALYLVPNSVYDKFQDEIVGNENFYGLLPNINLVLLGNLTESVLLKKGKDQIKEFTDVERQTIKDFKKFKSQFNNILKGVKRGRVTFLNDPAYTKDSDWNTVFKLLKSELKKYVDKWDSLEVLKEHMNHLNDIYEENNSEFEEVFNIQNEIVTNINKTDDDKKQAKKQIAKSAEDISKSLSKQLKAYIDFVSISLIDDLGSYTERVMRPNTILVAKHSAAEKKLRPSETSVLRALMFKEGLGEPTQEITGLDPYKWSAISGLSTKKCKPALTILKKHPISMQRLNIDAVVVDEIHNFNNIVHRSGAKGWNHSGDTYFDPATVGSRRGTNSTFYYRLEKTRGGTTKQRYATRYDSVGKSSDSDGTKLTTAAICMEIQSRKKEVNNVLLLSATPFTDTPFQVLSVLGMANYNLLLDNGIESAWDFYNNYVDETYKYDLRHDGSYGLFIDVNSYYNDKALSNLITNISNVKITDERIDASRPKKAIIPANRMKSVDGEESTPNTTIMGDVFDELVDVNSRIELTDNQKKFQEIIREYLGNDEDQRRIKEIFPIVGKRIEEAKADDLNEEVELLVAEKINEANEKDKNGDFSNADFVISYLQGLFDKGKYAQHPKIKEAIDHIDNKILGNKVEKPDEDTLEAVSIDTSQMTKIQKLAGKAIGAQQAQQALVISPYFVKLGDPSYKSPFLPDLEPDPVNTFINESPKLKFVVESIQQTIDYQKEQLKRGEINKIGGQVVYFDTHNFSYGGKKYNAFELLADYIAKNVDGISDEKDETGAYLEIATIDGSTKIEDSKVTGTKAMKKGRKTIKDEFNEGKIKIIIGSKAIKEGIDLQGNSHTMYICEAEFSPEVAMQLEGRIWRQKNPYDVVRIVYVLAMNTIDSFVYSKINRKVSQIKQMLELGVYEMNTTQFVIDTKEMLIQLESDPDKLTEIQFQDEVSTLKDEIAVIEKVIDRLKLVKVDYESIADKWTAAFTVLNKIYENLSEAQEKHIKNKYVKKEIKNKKVLKRDVDFRKSGYKGDIDEWMTDEKSSYNPLLYKVTDKEVDDRYEQYISENPKLRTLPKLMMPLSMEMQYSEIEIVVNKIVKNLKLAENIEQVWRRATEEEQDQIRNKKTKSIGELNWIAFYDVTESYDLNSFIRRWRDMILNDTKNISIVETYQEYIKNVDGVTMDDIDDIISSKEEIYREGSSKIADDESIKAFKDDLRAKWVVALEERKEKGDGSIPSLLKSMESSLPLIRLRSEEQRELILKGKA